MKDNKELTPQSESTVRSPESNLSPAADSLTSNPDGNECTTQPGNPPEQARSRAPNHDRTSTVHCAARDLPRAPGGPLEPGWQSNPPIRYDTTGWLSGATTLFSNSESSDIVQPRVAVGVMNSRASMPLVRYDTTGRLSGAFPVPDVAKVRRRAMHLGFIISITLVLLIISVIREIVAPGIRYYYPPL